MKKSMMLGAVAVAAVAIVVCTGEAIEPAITVQDGSTVLNLGADYTVAYENNVSNSDADDVEYDSVHFKGRLVDKTFTDADMQAADHYVLTGQNVVWVKDAGTLAAGKCWIELVPASETHARALSIVAEGGLTGISTVNIAMNNWLFWAAQNVLKRTDIEQFAKT